MSSSDESTLYVPSYVEREQDGLHILIAPTIPDWMATDHRGADLVASVARGRRFEGLVADYATREGVGPAKAWLHVHQFLREAQRHGFVAAQPFGLPPYAGREAIIQPTLRDLWLHLTDACNLACAHCLVAPASDAAHALPAPVTADIVDQAVELGAQRVFVTGGEPFLHPGLPQLAEQVIMERGKELVILTNGTMLRGRRWDRMRALDPQRLSLQISLDGSCPEVNDPLRGAGSFQGIIAGIQSAVAAGFSPTVATAVSGSNLDDLPAIVETLAALGVRHYHLLWMHKRGRAAAREDGLFPTTGRLIPALRKLRERAEELGVEVDNFAAWRARLNAPRSTHFDLGSAGVEALCVHPDGWAYPSAALAGVEMLRCGDLSQQSLARIWGESDVLRQLRRATVVRKPHCNRCAYCFLCGGGDVEQAYLHSAARSGNGSSVLEADPYCELHRALVEDTLGRLAGEGRQAINRSSGFDAPPIYAAMWSDGSSCQDNGPSVRTVPSLCVLSSHHDGARQLVRDMYAHAAREPQEALCCPTGYPSEEVDHIPPQVLDRAYGCASPVTLADIQPGEVVADLGSGAGIDCFIAARKVGPQGKVIGVDMTPDMLRVARESSVLVSGRLGYDVVTFREGFLEDLPIEDASADLVVSNCVVNLSPDKGQVFREIWRILKPGGRFVISDVVAQGEVSSQVRANPQLWGECIGGALAEEDFQARLERAGFSGLQTLRRHLWREVEGTRFLSTTVRGYKFEKSDHCVFQGQRAIYHGPLKAVVDEEGHIFPRGEPVEVCTDTARRLRETPYRDAFTVMEPDGEVEPYACCDEAGRCC